MISENAGDVIVERSSLILRVYFSEGAMIEGIRTSIDRRAVLHNKLKSWGYTGKATSTEASGKS